MYYFSQQIVYCGEKAELLALIADGEGYQSLLLGFKHEPDNCFGWKLAKHHLREPWSGFYKENPEKYEGYYCYWASIESVKENSKFPFRAKRKGEKIAHYRLCKKITELDQKFKDTHYAKTNNLSVLVPINISEDSRDEPEYYEDEDDEQPVPAW